MSVNENDADNMMIMTSKEYDMAQAKSKAKDAGNPWLAIVFLAVIPVMIPINIIVWKIAVGH